MHNTGVQSRKQCARQYLQTSTFKKKYWKLLCLYKRECFSQIILCVNSSYTVIDESKYWFYKYFIKSVWIMYLVNPSKVQMDKSQARQSLNFLFVQYCYIYACNRINSKSDELIFTIIYFNIKINVTKTFYS